MNNRDLDKIIREKLQDIHPTPSEQSWSLFEQRFDAESDFESLTDNMHFDTQVSRKSKSINPAISSQWPKLYQDLLIIERRQATVFKSKMIEIAAVLLFIYAFVSTPDVWNHNIDAKPATIPTQQLGPFAKADSRKSQRSKINSTQVQLPNKDINISSLVSIDVNPLATIDIQNEEMSNEILTESQINNKEVPSQALATVIGSDIADVVVTKENVTTEHSIITEQSIITDDQKLTQEETLVIENSRPTSGETDLETKPIAFIESQGKSEISITENENEEIAQIPSIALGANSSQTAPLHLKLISKLPKAYWNVGLWGSRDVNQINTPFDRIYQIDSYEKEALNYSIGASVSRKQGRFELTSGVDYASRTYQPKLYVEKYGTSDDYYFEKSLSKISYDIVSVPFKIKYDFISKNKWSSYFMIGAALNLIYNADYAINESVITGTPPAENFAPVERPRLARKFFNGGISGDSDSNIASIGASSPSLNTFANNYFIGLNCGFGLEKRINNKFSLYVEPSYQRHVVSHKVGIGPNNDKIHTLSIQLGAKSYLL